jgi:hypothetical protein
MPVPLSGPATRELPKIVGLLLSATSPASCLALIPEYAAGVSLEGCRLVVVTLPPDPISARARVLSLIQDRFVSFICCPTVYAVAVSVSTVPVTWAGGEEVAGLSVVELLREEPVVAAPVEPVTVAEPAVVEKHVTPPVVAEVEPVIPVVAVAEPITEEPMTEPKTPV